VKRALLITVVCAGLAAAADSVSPGVASPGAAVRGTDCKMPACIMVNGEDFAGLMAAHNIQFARIEELERELAVLKKSKGCAKLEVTEPPRNFVPKKEHDS
jgi:hypothetical protein